MQETQGTRVWEDLLDEEMASHSSILAWEISWTKRLGGYLGSQASDTTEHACTPDFLRSRCLVAKKVVTIT